MCALVVCINLIFRSAILLLKCIRSVFLYTASENEFKVFAGVAVLFRVSFIKIQTDDIFCFFAVIVQLYRIHAHCSTMIQCARRHG